MTGLHRRLCAALIAGLLLAAPFPVSADPSDPTEERGAPGANADPGSSKSGTFLDSWFGASEPALERFERPSDNYAALMQQRPLSLLLAQSRGYGLLSERATEDYLNEVLRKVMVAGGLGDLGVRAYLHSDRAISAVTSPDGAIYVNHGLLANLQNEGELAFLLAHELAHFLYKHHDSDWFVESQHGLLTSVEKMKEVSAELSGVIGRSDNKLNKKVQKASQIGAVVFDLSSVVVHPAWGREQEEEADLLGLDLVIAAGYNPYYANDLLQLIGDYEEQLRQKAGDAGGALGLRSLEAFGIINEDNAGNPLVQEFARGIGRMLSDVSSKHYPADERIETVSKYLEKFHPTYPEDEPAPAPWLDNPKHAVRAIDDRYSDAEEAQVKLAAGDIKGAAAYARKAVSGIAEKHAFTRLVFFDVRRRQGDLKNAGRNLEIALEADEPALMIYEMWLDVEEEAGRWDRVLEILSEAERRIGDSPTLLPHRILAFQALGRRNDAANLVTKCQYEHREISANCTEAAEGTRPKAPPIDRGNGRAHQARGKSYGGKPPLFVKRRGS